MKLSIGYLPNSDLAEKLLEHFLIPGTVPSLPSYSLGSSYYHDYDEIKQNQA
jgi:hypothetical protein